MNIAVVISGHLRTYDIENLKNNFLTQFPSENLFFFLSLWEINEDRFGGVLTPVSIATIKEFTSFLSEYGEVVVKTERNNREYFLQNFSSTSSSSLISPETPADASSMWYKIQDAFLLSELSKKEFEKEFVVLIRLRADTYFHVPVNREDILSIPEDSIGMANWHGKYEEATMRVMDHFWFCDYSTGKVIASLFKEIPRYLSEGKTPPSSEGFMSRCLAENNISIMYFPISYSIKRLNGLELVV